MIDRRLVANVDWLLLGATLLLALAGVATVYSATHKGALAGLHLKQLYLVAAGLVGLLLALLRRLPPARRSRGTFLRALGVGARVRALVRPPDRGHAPLDPPRRLPAPAQRVREARGGPPPGQGLRGVQSRDPRSARSAGARGGGGAARAPDRARARPRHRGLSVASVPGRGLPGRPPDEGGGRPCSSSWGCSPASPGRTSRTTRRPASTPSSTPPSIPRAPATRRSSRRSRWGRAASPEGVRRGQPVPARVPARAAHRLHPVGARRGAGLPRGGGASWASICSGSGACSRRRSSRVIGWGPSCAPRWPRGSRSRLCTIPRWWRGSCP